MSGVETRPVPVNILEWPKVRDMIQQHKNIYTELWYNPNASACGCFLYGLEATAARLGMTSGSLQDAIPDFVRRNLIDFDKATGEVFVIDWPRWHNFKTPAGQGALAASIGKIQSSRLRALVEKSYESTLLACKGKGKGKGKVSSAKAEEEEEEEEEGGAERPAPAQSAPGRAAFDGKEKTQKHPTYSPTGIVCWNEDDRAQAAMTEEQHKDNLDLVRRAVKACTGPAGALPSYVTKTIAELIADDVKKAQQAEAQALEISEREKSARYDEETKRGKELLGTLSDAERRAYATRFVKVTEGIHSFNPETGQFTNRLEETCFKGWLCTKLRRGEPSSSASFE